MPENILYCAVLWRDLSSSFDVVGPYYTSLEMQFLHSIVTKTMLVFSQFEFNVCALLCDGASSNLSLLKLLCGYVNNEIYKHLGLSHHLMGKMSIFLFVHLTRYSN